MKINKNFIFKGTLNKIIIYISVIIILLTSLMIIEYYSYSKFFNNFKSSFDNNKFSQANNLILTDQEFNPIKSISLKNDLSNYFITTITTLKQNLEENNLTTEEILLKINEIDRYGLNQNEISSFTNSIPFLENSIKNYSDGINYFDDNKYSEALTCFNNISPLDPKYNEALTYIHESKDKIKETVFAECEDLCNSDYYKQALSKLSNSSDMLGNDNDINLKIAEIKLKQQEYVDKDSSTSQALSNSSVFNISSQNINTLNLKSNTPYLINISIKNQKTYIYKGTSDDWALDRTFSCSTGIKGEDTPLGCFSIKEKGDWFFSDKYQQGGKYWTQIDGNILFHSFPFDKDQNTVLDTTLNKRSSHGCIRLSLNDSKWIYDNIPKDTTVIIK